MTCCRFFRSINNHSSLPTKIFIFAITIGFVGLIGLRLAALMVQDLKEQSASMKRADQISTILLGILQLGAVVFYTNVEQNETLSAQRRLLHP